MADTTFEQDVQIKVTSYLDGESVSSGQLSMLTDLAIEKFKIKRNYPSSYTTEQVETDLRKHLNTIAYGVVELFAKDGVEGQNSHSENGISRSYKDDIISAYSDVIAFANVRSL